MSTNTGGFDTWTGAPDRTWYNPNLKYSTGTSSKGVSTGVSGLAKKYAGYGAKDIGDYGGAGDYGWYEAPSGEVININKDAYT